MNFLEETKRKLTYHGLDPSSVRWVGSSDGEYVCTWQAFTRISDFEYHNGYGAQEVARDLVIVGDDYWLERREYDGAECWELKRMPVLSPTRVGLSVVGIGAWDSVADLHNREEE